MVKRISTNKRILSFVAAIELDINVLDARKPYLPFEEFYNEPLSDTIEMDIDFGNYKEISRGEIFSFYLPYKLLFNLPCGLGCHIIFSFGS